jgi:hypothetical protein
MLIVAFAACASTRTQESAGEYVEDSVITTKVKSLLAADDFLKSFQISVETFKGEVQLSGFVNSQKAVDKAVEIARSEAPVILFTSFWSVPLLGCWSESFKAKTNVTIWALTGQDRQIDSGHRQRLVDSGLHQYGVVELFKQ